MSFKTLQRLNIIIIVICILFTSVIPVHAEDTGEGEWDEEKREEAWMTYLSTSWPIRKLRVSANGISMVEDKTYNDVYDGLYSEVIQAALEELDDTEIAEECLYTPSDYYELMRFICAYQMVAVYGGNPEYSMYKGITGSGEEADNLVFVFDSNRTDGTPYESFEENGHNYIWYPAGTNICKHDENDIGFTHIFFGENLSYNANAEDGDIQKKSIQILFKHLIANEVEDGCIIGDIYNSDQALAGMVLRMYCPEYDYGEWYPDWFQDHMAGMLADENKWEKIKTGKLYPWVYNMGFVKNGEENGCKTSCNRNSWGINYGDSDEDGIVDSYASSNAVLRADDDPTVLMCLKEEYTGCPISYTIDNYAEWGVNLDFSTLTGEDYEEEEESEE